MTRWDADIGHEGPKWVKSSRSGGSTWHVRFRG